MYQSHQMMAKMYQDKAAKEAAAKLAAGPPAPGRDEL